MIHIFIGTKAQFIKMAPIMINLNDRDIPYTFIDSGQHAKLVNDLIPQFGLKAPDVFLRRKHNNITTFRFTCQNTPVKRAHLKRTGMC